MKRGVSFLSLPTIVILIYLYHMLLCKMDAISAREIPLCSMKNSSHETPFDERCPNCGCITSEEWPDLAQIEGSMFYEESKHYFQAAVSGCPLCRIVVAVLRDATEKRCAIGPKQGYFSVNLLRSQGHFILMLKDTGFDLQDKYDYVVVYQAGEQSQHSK